MKTMMIPTLIILLWSCTRPTANQESTISADSTDCTKGKRQAELDFQNGSFGRYYYGLPSPKFNSYVKHLKNKYNIQVQGGGDIIEDFGTCYNEVMDKHLTEKFGNDFFEKMQKEIDSLYASDLGDREVSYVGGNKALEQFFACNVRIPSTNQERTKVYLDLAIDNSGQVTSATIKKGINRDYDTEALRVGRMLTWSPAIEDQKTISSKITIAIIFDRALRKANKCD